MELVSIAWHAKKNLIDKISRLEFLSARLSTLTETSPHSDGFWRIVRNSIQVATRRSNRRESIIFCTLSPWSVSLPEQMEMERGSEREKSSSSYMYIEEGLQLDTRVCVRSSMSRHTWVEPSLSRKRNRWVWAWRDCFVANRKRLLVDDAKSARSHERFSIDQVEYGLCSQQRGILDRSMESSGGSLLRWLRRSLFNSTQSWSGAQEQKLSYFDRATRELYPRSLRILEVKCARGRSLSLSDWSWFAVDAAPCVCTYVSLRDPLFVLDKYRSNRSVNVCLLRRLTIVDNEQMIEMPEHLWPVELRLLA